MDKVLEALYDNERSGGLGKSSPNVARWLGDIRTYFPAPAVKVMQQDALVLRRDIEQRAGLGRVAALDLPQDDHSALSRREPLDRRGGRLQAGRQQGQGVVERLGDGDRRRDHGQLRLLQVGVQLADRQRDVLLADGDLAADVRGDGRAVPGVHLGGVRDGPVDVVADLQHVDNLHDRSSSPAARGPNHVRAQIGWVEHGLQRKAVRPWATG